jgi:NadR type nicotinamide-nucleotide adenylyltransferase
MTQGIKRGFVLGKFMPPHAGHLGLCRTAARLCDQLSVLVCSRDVEPIAGGLRAAWMRDLLPQAQILHMHEDIPQQPQDHPEFWTLWQQAVRRFHPHPIDLVFGSEPYVLRLAAELNAEPVVLDPDRQAFPVSATQIRTDPAAMWNHIPDLVRPYYQKRVVLFGPESVGKTTLARQLAQRFHTAWVPEYGRTYDQFRPQRPWTSADFLAIAQRHTALRHAVAATAGPILFEDTDPLLTGIWEQMLTGQHRSRLIETTPLADLYLLLNCDVPWQDDGSRYFPDQRRDIFMDLCRDALNQRGATVCLIEGPWSQRQDRAEHAITLHTGIPVA